MLITLNLYLNILLLSFQLGSVQFIFVGYLHSVVLNFIGLKNVQFAKVLTQKPPVYRFSFQIEIDVALCVCMGFVRICVVLCGVKHRHLKTGYLAVSIEHNGKGKTFRHLIIDRQ